MQNFSKKYHAKTYNSVQLDFLRVEIRVHKVQTFADYRQLGIFAVMLQSSLWKKKISIWILSEKWQIETGQHIPGGHLAAYIHILDGISG